METLLPISSMFAASAVSALFSAIWEGTVLAVCVLACLRMLPQLSAAARSAIWISVFLLLVGLHLVPSGGGHGWGVRGQAAPLHLGLAWSLGIAAVWLVLSLVRGTQLAISAVRVRGLARRAVPVTVDEDCRKLLRTEVVGGVARRSAELCTSTEVERPSVLGFFRPRILIPPVLLERLTSVELQQVVVHEMEHLRRADDWTNLLQKLALVAFPLNPALVWVERRLCAERELACDDSVLRVNGGRKAYAICLTHLAEYSMLRRGLSLALGAWERQSELVRRVHRILRRPAEVMSRRQTYALSGGLIAGVVGCALGLARSPQMVSFDEPVASAVQNFQGNFRAVNAEQMMAGQLGTARAMDATQAMGTKQAMNTRQAVQAHAQMVNAIMPQGSTTAGFRAEEGNAPVKTLAKNASLPRTSPTTSTRSTSMRGTSMLKTSMRTTSMRRTKRGTPQPSQRAWVVMTAWSDEESASQLVFAVAQTDRDASQVDPNGSKAELNGKTTDKGISADGNRVVRATYRVRTTYAVPLPDGWLIIQI